MEINYEKIVEANKLIKATDVKGKGYAEVNQRIKAFRFLYPKGAIITEMLSNENGVCVFRAEAFDEENNLLGTGTAYEKESSSFINKTSYIENCETSAVGRCLGMLALGIDTSIASAEEVANAINNQEKSDEKFGKETIKWNEYRTELESLGCNFRDEKTNDYILKKAKVDSQEISSFADDIEGLIRLNKVYKGMIKAKKESN